MKLVDDSYTYKEKDLSLEELYLKSHIMDFCKKLDSPSDTSKPCSDTNFFIKCLPLC